MLSENSFLIVLTAIRKLIPKINTITEKSERKFSNSRFGNDLHDKKNKNFCYT